jgi:hypothetical protein
MTCSNQREPGGAAAREGRRVSLPCAIELYPSMDAVGRAVQQLKREAYEAHRRRYAADYKVRQLEINPLLKDWLS